MKKLLMHVAILLMLLGAQINQAGATTRVWTGALGATGSDWNTTGNWLGGVVPKTGDDVTIGLTQILITSPTFPLGSTISLSSITFGALLPSLFGPITLTVNGNMTVTGTVTQSPTILTSYVTIIAGTGSLTCGNVQVGTNSPLIALTNVLTNTTLKLISTINNLHVTGNVTVSTTSITITVIVVVITLGKIDAAFSLQSGTTLVDGYILTQTNPTGAGSPTFIVEPPASTSAKLQLSGLVPINTACLSGSVDFYNSTGNGVATIEYNNTTGTSGSPQTVYSSTPAYLDASPSVYQNIKFTGAGQKGVQSGNVTIAGDWASSGGKVDAVSNNPTVIFQGAGQNLSDTSSDSGNGVVFKNVNFQASGTKLISLGNFAVSSAGILTMATTLAPTTSTTLNANSLLTLQSAASSTAAVAVIPTGCTITGIVHVQRFITGGNSNSNRGYRLLASPVNQTNSTSSLSNTFSISYIRDHTFNGISYAGAYTGGTTGVSGGFNIQSYGPSVYLWDERKVNDNKSYTSGKNIGVNKLTTNTFPAANTVDLSDGTTSLAIPVGNGYELFFIGPSTRANSSTATTPADAVLTAHGYLNQQNVTVNLWYTPAGGSSGNLSYTAGLASGPGYNMVGNPYASTINLNSVLTANTGINNIYLLSAKNSPNQTFIAFTINGTSAPSAGFAVSGEGFIVHATGTGSTLTFTESQKSPTTQLTGPALIMSAPKSDQLTVNGAGLSTGAFKNDVSATPFASAQDALTGMYVKITQDSLTYNYCGIYFGSQWSANFQQGDAADFGGNAPRVMMASFSADGVRSAVKHFPDYRTKNQLIKLYAAGKTDGMYTLSLEGIRNIDTVNYKITLYDKYKKDSTDIGRYKSYAFNQTIADTASYGANRFVLGIAQLPGSKYQLATFTAQKANDGVLVTWRALNEGSNYFFTLEKQQANGTDYSPVYNIQSNGGTIYKFTDKTPNTGNNVYRLKQVDLFGNITYAGPVSVYYDQTGNEGLFKVYPNPTAETLNINVTYGKTNTTASTYKLNIYDATGALVMQKSSSNVNWSENVSQFKPGVYIVELKNTTGDSLGKAKFLKR